ncbi:unnamed protein product [Camellia sinensis]
MLAVVVMKCRDRLHELVKEEIENKDSSTEEWKIVMERSFKRMDNEIPIKAPGSAQGCWLMSEFSLTSFTKIAGLAWSSREPWIFASLSYDGRKDNLEQDESRSFRHQLSSSITNSPPGSWPQFGSPIEHNPLQTLSHSPGFSSMSPTIDCKVVQSLPIRTNYYTGPWKNSCCSPIKWHKVDELVRHVMDMRH